MKHNVILAPVDVPDVDNLLQLFRLLATNPHARILALVTGRPVHPDPDHEVQLWDWDLAFSQDVLKVNIGRMGHLLRGFGNRIQFFDGGIAPRTPVPHWKHFHEYYRMADIDPIRALHLCQMKSMTELVRILLACPDASVPIVVGGPMTGLAQVMNRDPRVAQKFSELHAMFATWGKSKMMSLDGTSRNGKQFNVECDPQSAHHVLNGLSCPIHLLPTEVTRVKAIGFWELSDLQATLPRTQQAHEFLQLYHLWYHYVVLPQRDKNPDEMIFTHDLAGALSLLIQS
ncbi:nucleoside hydrolase [Candidatus Uhrbacteria bacterium]|nr:nucleoside hydrolase [Candidatus Uhrbacteria bacterium]